MANLAHQTDVGSAMPLATNGSVLFVSGGKLAQDNDKLFFDATNFELGVGTASPAAMLHVAQDVKTTGSPTAVLVAGGAHTTLTTATEATDINLNLARTVQFAEGDIATQRAVRIQAPTYGIDGAGGTITNAATLHIDNCPQLGAGAAITNAYSLWVDAGLARFDGNGTDVFELPADATDPTSGGGAATGRIPVRIGGATVYIPYY